MPLGVLRRSAHFLLLAGISFAVSTFAARGAAQESILVTTTDSVLGVYDLVTCTLQKSFPTTYFNSSVAVGVNPRLAFLSGNNGFMTVVDLTIGKEIKRIYNVGASGLTAITPDGKTLIVWDDFNATLDLIDIPSLTVTKRINLLPTMHLENADAGGDVVLAGNKVFLLPIFTDYANIPPQAGVVDLTTSKVTAIPFKRVSFFEGWTGNAVLTPDGKYVAVIGDFEEQNGPFPELLLVDTSTYAITSHMLEVDPDAIVVNPNHSDQTKYFG